VWYHTALRERKPQSVRAFDLIAWDPLIVYSRNAARQLRDRCHSLVLSFREFEEKAVSTNIAQARNAVHEYVPS